MKKKKVEQCKKDSVKYRVCLGIAIVGLAGFVTFATLCGSGNFDQTLGMIFAIICAAIGLVFSFYGQHIIKNHAVSEKSTLEEGNIKSNNFEELMDNVSNSLSSVPRKVYICEDHLHDPIILNQGVLYTYVLVQEKNIIKNFVFLYVTDFSKFDFKRDLTIIWNRVRGEINDHDEEIIARRPWGYVNVIGKRVTYCVCVDKHTEGFQQYLDDNAGKYNEKGNGAFFVDVNEFSYDVYNPSAPAASCSFKINDKLEAGICFESKKRYHLVPSALNKEGYGKMREWFLEIMKDC